jgi:hypothetical protein
MPTMLQATRSVLMFFYSALMALRPFLVVVAVAVLNLQLFTWAAIKDQQLKAPSVSTPVGRLVAVELHPWLITDKSTVHSTNGEIFQVKGAVSATKDDRLTLKTREPGLLHMFDGDSLCVTSRAGSTCYPLL